MTAKTKTKSTDWRTYAQLRFDARLPYIVQQSDGGEKFGRDGFDFGGVSGGLAQFLAKGDAILYAIEVFRRDSSLAVRVLDARNKCQEVFRKEPSETIKEVES